MRKTYRNPSQPTESQQLPVESQSVCKCIGRLRCARIWPRPRPTWARQGPYELSSVDDGGSYDKSKVFVEHRCLLVNMKALEPAKRIQRARVRIAFHILSIILMLKGFTDTLWVIESAIMQSLKKLFDSVLSAALLCFHWNSQDGWNRPLVRALRWEAKLEAEVIPNAWWSAENTIHMVVSIQLKNISQNGNLPQIGVKIKNIWNRHLAIYGSANWPVFWWCESVTTSLWPFQATKAPLDSTHFWSSVL